MLFVTLAYNLPYDLPRPLHLLDGIASNQSQNPFMKRVYPRIIVPLIVEAVSKPPSKVLFRFRKQLLFMNHGSRESFYGPRQGA